VRAFAFTALTFENTCFFGLLIMSLRASRLMVIMHDSCSEGVVSCRIAKGRERESAADQRGAGWKSVTFSRNGPNSVLIP
jgi:hypothetical protein